MTITEWFRLLQILDTEIEAAGRSTDERLGTLSFAPPQDEHLLLADAYDGGFIAPSTLCVRGWCAEDRHAFWSLRSDYGPSIRQVSRSLSNGFGV